MELSTFTPEQIKGRHYGCHNRAPYLETLWVQNGWKHIAHDNSFSRMPRMVPTPFRMAQDCQFTLTELGQVDARCDACKHRIATP